MLSLKKRCACGKSSRNIILTEGSFWSSADDTSGITLSVFCLFLLPFCCVFFFFSSNPHNAL